METAAALGPTSSRSQSVSAGAPETGPSVGGGWGGGEGEGEGDGGRNGRVKTSYKQCFIHTHHITVASECNMQ